MTPAQRRAARARQAREAGQRFQDYCALWEREGGPGAGLDWLAAHVGALVARVAALERTVRRLERQQRKQNATLSTRHPHR